MSGVEGGSIFMAAVLLFGAQHSPAWFGLMAHSATAAWGMVGTERSWFNGIGTFQGGIHVDDLVGVIPGLGDRPEQASRAFDKIAECVAGKNAISKVKNDFDGFPVLTLGFWGFKVDASLAKEKGLKGITASIEHVKLLNMQAQLSDEFFAQVRDRNVSMKVHQRIQGLAVWFSRVSKSVKVLLAYIYQMDRSHSQEKLAPKGGKKEVSRQWLEYAEACVVLRALLIDLTRFELPLVATMSCVLSPVEQIVLGMPRLILGSDATPLVVCVVDYEAEEYAAHAILDFMRELHDSRGCLNQEARISQCEMLPVVAMAMKNGHRWRGKLVIAMIDNVEACAAVNKKPPADSMMRYLQSVLTCCEIRNGFEMYSPYINTHHNVLTDDGSRLLATMSEDEFHAHIVGLQPGLVRTSLLPQLAFMLEQQGEGEKRGVCMINAFAILGQDEYQEGLVLAKQQVEGMRQDALLMDAGEEGLLERVEQGVRFAVVVVNAGVGQLAAAVEAAGGECLALTETGLEVGKIAQQRVCVGSPQCRVFQEWTGECSQKADLVMVDAYFEGRRKLVDVIVEVKFIVKDTKPSQVVWVQRSSFVLNGGNVERVDQAMQECGYCRVPIRGADGKDEVEVVDAALVRGSIQCRRILLHYESVEVANALGPLTMLPRDVGQRKPIKSFLEDPECIPEKCWMEGSLERGPPRCREKGSAQTAGFLSFQHPITKKKVRQEVQNEDEFIAVAPKAWNYSVEGVGGMLIKQGTRVRPLQLSEVARLQRIPSSVIESLGDVNATVPFWVGSAISGALAKAIVTRCKERWRLLQVEEEKEVQFSLKRRKARGGPSKVGQCRSNAHVPISSLVSTLIGSSIRYTTEKTYSAAFSHFRIWRWYRGLPLFLEGDPGDEEDLMQFVAHRGLVAGYAYGSIHVMLFAIRMEHLKSRYGDPLVDKLLLKIVMRGLKRLQGGVIRKIPVTVELLLAVLDALDLTQWDDVVAATAIMFMYLFLLRSREALRKDGADAKQCVRVCMLAFYNKGVEVFGDGILEADEVVWLSAYSKTDPNGQGGVHNVFAAPGRKLCVLNLLKKMYLMRPSHFAKSEQFLFVCDDGKVLHRDVVAKLLSKSAVVLGVPPEAVSVISIRAGGASAMYDAGFSVEEIKKRGRWASECWRVYVWDGRDRTRELASRMLGSSVSMVASLAYYKRHASEE